MARIETTVLIDDLDGVSKAQETIQFSWEGIHYEIHLTTKNAAEFRNAVNEWIPYAARVSHKNTGGRHRSPARESSQIIRDWARSQGIDVPDRGRIRDEIKLAYAAAHHPYGTS